MGGSEEVAEAQEAPEAADREDAVKTIEYMDLLGVQGCIHADSCVSHVNRFREAAEHKQTQKIWRVFTPRTFRRLDLELLAEKRFAAASFDLKRFQNLDEALEAARVMTSKRGTVNRKIGRAKRLGYYVKPFAREAFIPDVYEIHTSLPNRGGKPLRPAYLKTVEEMGGPAESFIEPPQPACPVHHSVHWGVFKPEPGHKQGNVVTNERLVAYISHRRYGNHSRYSRIMGHGDHLSFGIMYLLHFSILEDLYVNGRSGLRYVCYGAWLSGRGTGLTKWKRLCGFEPRYILYPRPHQAADITFHFADESRRTARVAVDEPAHRRFVVNPEVPEAGPYVYPRPKTDAEGLEKRYQDLLQLSQRCFRVDQPRVLFPDYRIPVDAEHTVDTQPLVFDQLQQMVNPVHFSELCVTSRQYVRQLAEWLLSKPDALVLGAGLQDYRALPDSDKSEVDLDEFEYRLGWVLEKLKSERGISLFWLWTGVSADFHDQRTDRKLMASRAAEYASAAEGVCQRYEVPVHDLTQPVANIVDTANAEFERKLDDKNRAVLEKERRLRLAAEVSRLIADPILDWVRGGGIRER